MRPRTGTGWVKSVLDRTLSFKGNCQELSSEMERISCKYARYCNEQIYNSWLAFIYRYFM